MKNLNTLGRLLLAIPFLIFGINHFLFYDVFLGMLTSFIPNSVYLIFLVGALLIASSIAIIINRQVILFCYVLAALLILFILTIHIPYLLQGGADYHFSLFALLKDTGLLGGLIMIISSYKETETETK